MSHRRYRIAMVAPGPFPAPRGSQVLVRELAEALAAAGHEVHLIAYASGDPAIRVAGVRVHRTPPAFGGRQLYGPGWQRVALNLLLACRLLEVVRRERIDVIHAHNYEAPLLAYAVRALTKVPVVYHGHNVMSDELMRYFRRPVGQWLARVVGRMLDRSIPRRADYVVALSNRMAAFLRDNGVAREQLAVIPPGIRIEEGGDCVPAPAEADPYPAAKVILYAGNLDPYQDLSTLVEAMGAIRLAEPRALLVVVTHPSHTGAVREAALLRSTPSVRVVFAHGFDAVQRMMRRADVVVCPRTSWSGFPIKLLNYMAAGRVIVAAAGAASAMEDGPLVVVPNGDSAALSRAIVATLRDPVGSAKLGQAARELACNAFSWPLLVPRMLRVYEEVVHPGGEARRPVQEDKKVLQNESLWGLMEDVEDHITRAASGTHP